MVQNRVLYGGHALHLVLEAALTSTLIVVTLGQDLVLVDIASLLRNRLSTQDVHADHILLVELLGPALWDPILDLVLDHDLVGALGQGLRQGLLVQLVKLVVELGDHLLDVCAFLFSIDLLKDSDLHVLL